MKTLELPARELDVQAVGVLAPVTPFEQLLSLLPQLSMQERGRLRYLLTRPGNHSPEERSKVGTNVVQGAK